MTYPIPTVIYRIGDLKNAFTMVHAKRTADLGADALSTEMTMGNAMVAGVKASLEALDALNDNDYIALPDEPSELTTALHNRLTKSLGGYMADNQYRVIPEDVALALLPR